jgi:hypothetical protein
MLAKVKLGNEVVALGLKPRVNESVLGGLFRYCNKEWFIQPHCSNNGHCLVPSQFVLLFFSREFRSHVILFVCAVLTVGPENLHKGMIDQWSKDMTLNLIFLLRFWFFNNLFDDWLKFDRV